MTDNGGTGSTTPEERLTKAPTPEIALTEYGVAPGSVEQLHRLALLVVKGGIGPKGMSPETALVAMLAGRRLGIDPIQSMTDVTVVNGKPTIYGDPAKAIVEGSGYLQDIKEYVAPWCHDCQVESDGVICPNCAQPMTDKKYRGAICSVLRKDRERWVTRGFNQCEAERAQLWGKPGPWKQFPQRMMMYRARGYAFRDTFGDLLRGFHLTEEIEPAVEMKPVKVWSAPPVELPSLEEASLQRLAKEEQVITYPSKNVVQTGIDDFTPDAESPVPDVSEPSDPVEKEEQDTVLLDVPGDFDNFDYKGSGDEDRYLYWLNKLGNSADQGELDQLVKDIMVKHPAKGDPMRDRIKQPFIDRRKELDS